MAKMIALFIDGHSVSVPEGTLIVDAAKKCGTDIPVFCYHPKMEPVGMCRMCLVEIGRPMIDRATNQPVLEADGSPKIQFGPKLETACTTPVSEGMAVVTTSPKVKAARREVLEFLLTSHPLDCPMDYESVSAQLGAQLGSASVIILDESVNMAWLVKKTAHFFKHESCGKCTPCREGTYWMMHLADRIVAGEAKLTDIDLINTVAHQIQNKCLCPLGEFAIMSVMSGVEKFRPDFEELIK